MTKFVHMELNCSDPDAAKAFYRDVFGWTYQDMPMPEGVYTMVMAGEEGIGGIQKHPMPDAPSAWTGYIGVDSAEATLADVEKAGGNVVVPIVTIPQGKFAVIADPTGATFAIWESLQPPPAPAEEKPESAKPAKKKAAKKKAAKKKAAKKKPAKKAAEKKPAKKKAAKKKAAKKKPAKKAAKKKPAKKKAAKKKPAKKKAAKKKPAKKKAAKKKATKKKATKKKATKKKATKKKATKKK